MKDILQKKYIATPAMNKYLGNCIMIAYKIKSEIIEEPGYTADEILILVKTIEKPSVVCSFQKNKFLKREHFGSCERIPLRLSSACLTSSLGDTACRCYTDSIKYLKEINNRGVGVFVYIPQEGFGRGLFAKIADHSLQNGIDINGKRIKSLSFKNSVKLLYPEEDYDIRKYGIIKDLFKAIGIDDFPYLYLGKCGDKITKIQNDSGLDII